MKKNNKTTPFLMILVLSIVATQLSLRAMGINITPSMGTVVHSWGKVAGLIGGVYQPGFITELGTLSNHLLCNEGKVLVETENSCSELACNKVKDFEFELPPPIDVNDPSVTIEEPVQEPSVKTVNTITGRQEYPKTEPLHVERMEIVADAYEDGSVAEPKAESREELVRPADVGFAAVEPEAENKLIITQPDNRVSFSDEEATAAPKAEKAKKPCPDVERLKKLEEMKKLQEEFQIEPDGQFVQQTMPGFGFQAFQASQSFEKSKHIRVIIKWTPSMLHMIVPRSADKENVNLVNTAE
jgi:hypothetical protein